MKNLFFIGTATFIIPFVSSLAVSLNLTASAFIGGLIAATVTITIVWFLSKKYQRAFKKLDGYAESLKNLESQIATLKKQNLKLLKEIKGLKEEEKSLKTQLEELQNSVNNLESKEKQALQLTENKPQLQTIKTTKNRLPERREVFWETNTLYAQQLTSISKDFWSIYEYNIDVFRSQTTPKNRGFYWKKLEHGLEILSEEKTLVAYFAIYGGSHYYKLSYLLEQLFINLTQSRINENIEIIDYGCGQALATTCFIDYFKENGLSNKTINRVTLIEPSQIALSRGILHINHLGLDLQNTEIKPINKKLEDLNKNDLLTSSKNLKIHLFSNILDVTGFEIKNLANTIRETQSGINYFLCVSPNDLKNRILQFFNFWNQNEFRTEEIPLSSEDLYREIWWFKSDEFNRRKIHRTQKLFYVNL